MLFSLAAGAACLTGLAFAGEAKADTVYKKTTVVRSGYSRSYYQSYGVRYSKGYYFSGRHHNHWGHRRWDSYRRTYVYWEPVLRVYYYYDEVQGGYYPCD
jgi:hypothetical protein